MVFEDLLMFTCVGIEGMDIEGYKTIRFGIGDLTPAKTLTIILTLTEISKELINYIEENADPETFNVFISCLQVKMDELCPCL